MKKFIHKKAALGIGLLLILSLACIYLCVKGTRNDDARQLSSKEFLCPDSDIDYIDDKLYMVIKEAYDAIDFSGDFNPGNYDKYDLYRAQFKKMLDGEVAVWLPDTGEEVNLYDLGEIEKAMETGNEHNKFIYNCTYYFFDMDGDNNPELFITDNMRFTDIFKYEEESDQIILWQEYISSRIFFYGTQKLGFGGVWSGHGIIDGLIGLDSSGDYDFIVRFKTEYKSQDSWDDYSCFVALPDCIELSDWMKSQAVYDNVDERYYFQVTQEQFDELTGEYYRMRKEVSDRRKDVTYTYEELFGNM